MIGADLFYDPDLGIGVVHALSRLLPGARNRKAVVFSRRRCDATFKRVTDVSTDTRLSLVVYSGGVGADFVMCAFPSIGFARCWIRSVNSIMRISRKRCWRGWENSRSVTGIIASSVCLKLQLTPKASKGYSFESV